MERKRKEAEAKKAAKKAAALAEKKLREEKKAAEKVRHAFVFITSTASVYFFHRRSLVTFPNPTLYASIIISCYLIIQERKRLAAEEKKAKKLAKKQRKKQEASKLKGERETKVQNKSEEKEAETENPGVETTDCESMTDVIMVCKSDAVELTAEDDWDDVTEPPALLFTKTFDEV